MLFEKIIELVRQQGWEQQKVGRTRFSGNVGTIFYKDGMVLTVSIVEEGSMTYPDKEEIKEMFGHG